MKKILALGLAIIMIVMAIVSCNPGGKGDESSTPKESIPSGPASSPDSTPDSTPGDSTPDSSTPPPAPVIEFENRNETVYVVGTEYGLKLRTETDFDDETNVAYYVSPGEELKRTGYHETWSRIEYEGEEYYASSKFLSTEKTTEELPPEVTITFTPKNETVCVTTEEGEGGMANIRSYPSLDSKYVITALAHGTELKRTGIAFDTENNPDGDLGWSRVEYEGQICYMRNSVLTVKKVNSGTTSTTDTPYKVYNSVKAFFVSAKDISVSGSITQAYAGQTFVTTAVAKAKGIGTDAFVCYIESDGLKITYVGGVSYIETSEGKVKTETPKENMMASFSIDNFMGYALSEFSLASVDKKVGSTVLTLKGLPTATFAEDILGVTADMFATTAEYQEFLESIKSDAAKYTETYTLDSNGKVTKTSLSYSFVGALGDGTTVNCQYKEENTISTNVADITVPEDADSYIAA